MADKRTTQQPRPSPEPVRKDTPGPFTGERHRRDDGYTINVAPVREPVPPPPPPPPPPTPPGTPDK